MTYWGTKDGTGNLLLGHHDLAQVTSCWGTKEWHRRHGKGH